jgi:hypothetical protein
MPLLIDYDIKEFRRGKKRVRNRNKGLEII